jgi:hypothetical protein
MAADSPIRSEIPAVKLSGVGTTIEKAALDELRTSLRGQLLVSGDVGYDSARRIWNGMIDRRPALIARCAGATDVAKAITSHASAYCSSRCAAADTASPAIPCATAA